MTNYSFSPICKYPVAAPWGSTVNGLRISASRFTNNQTGRVTVAAALERNEGGKWVIDGEHAYERTANDLTAGMVESDLIQHIHRQLPDASDVLPMGYFSSKA